MGKYPSLATRIKCFKQTLGILLSASVKIATIPKSLEHIFYCSYPALELKTDYHKHALFLDVLNIKQMYSSVQFSRSVMSDSLRPHELQHARPPCQSPTPRVYSNSYPSIHLILCHLLLLLSSIFPSIRVFSDESVLCIRCPKYWSFSFSISPSNPRLISFRVDWLDLLAVQGTLKSLLQHHSSNASNL